MLILILYENQIHSQTLTQANRLMTAIKANDLPNALRLAMNLKDVNHQFENNFSLLHAATLSGDADIVKLLLDKGANPDLRDSDGNTPLILAINSRHANVVKLLLGKGANPDIRNNIGATSLIIASCLGELESVKFLLDKNANKDLKDNKDGTALIGSIYCGHSEILELLLDNGDNKNRRDKRNRQWQRYCGRVNHPHRRGSYGLSACRRRYHRYWRKSRQGHFRCRE